MEIHMHGFTLDSMLCSSDLSVPPYANIKSSFVGGLELKYDKSLNFFSKLLGSLNFHINCSFSISTEETSGILIGIAFQFYSDPLI